MSPIRREIINLTEELFLADEDVFIEEFLENEQVVFIEDGAPEDEPPQDAPQPSQPSPSAGTIGEVGGMLNSHCESMQLQDLHEQAITRPLPHHQLVQLQCTPLLLLLELFCTKRSMDHSSPNESNVSLSKK